MGNVLPKIDAATLAKPTPKPLSLGETSDAEPNDALAALSKAAAPAAISKTLAEAINGKPKGSRAGTQTITGRLSPNQKTWFKIAAAKRGMTLEDYLKYCITTTFEKDGITDDTGASIIIA